MCKKIKPVENYTDSFVKYENVSDNFKKCYLLMNECNNIINDIKYKKFNIDNTILTQEHFEYFIFYKFLLESEHFELILNYNIKEIYYNNNCIILLFNEKLIKKLHHYFTYDFIKNDILKYVECLLNNNVHRELYTNISLLLIEMEKNKNKYALIQELNAKLPFKFTKQPQTLHNSDKPPIRGYDYIVTKHWNWNWNYDNLNGNENGNKKVTEIILDDLQDPSSDNDSEISWNIPSI